MTQKTQTPSIKLGKDIKIRLNKYKKFGTYAMVIESFLDYFDSTGIKPTDINMSPVFIVKSATERTIKIIRNIEKTKIDPLLLIVEDIRKMQSFKNDLPVSNNISNEEVQGLIEKIGILEKQVQKKKEEVILLNKKVIENIEVTDTGKYDETLKRIKELLTEIDKQKTESKLKRSDWQIEKNLYNRNLESALNLINDTI